MAEATTALVTTLRSIADGLEQCGAAAKAGRITDLTVLQTIGAEYETLSVELSRMAETVSAITALTVPFLARA
jgi:hypothetical protein